MDDSADPPRDDKPSLRDRVAGLGARRLTAAAAGAILVVVLLVVLAGGGEEQDRDPGVAFRAQAQAICATAQRQIAELKTPATLAELVTVSRRAARITGRARAGLAALEPPAGISADMPALLTSLARQQRLAQQLATSAGRGSRSGVRKLVARGRREDVRTGRAAQRVGLEACARTGRS